MGTTIGLEKGSFGKGIMHRNLSLTSQIRGTPLGIDAAKTNAQDLQKHLEKLRSWLQFVLGRERGPTEHDGPSIIDTPMAFLTVWGNSSVEMDAVLDISSRSIVPAYALAFTIVRLVICLHVAVCVWLRVHHWEVFCCQDCQDLCDSAELKLPSWKYYLSTVNEHVTDFR